MPEPLTPEALAEIREMAGQPLRTQIDVAVVLRHRELLLAHFDRLYVQDVALQTALDEALGPDERASASQGPAVDVAYLAQQRDEARQLADLAAQHTDRITAAGQAEVARLTAERDEARRSADTWRQCHDRHAAEADRLQAERDQLRARLGQAWTATEALADEVGYPPLGDLRAALLIDGRAPASKGAHDA